VLVHDHAHDSGDENENQNENENENENENQNENPNLNEHPHLHGRADRRYAPGREVRTWFRRDGQRLHSSQRAHA